VTVIIRADGRNLFNVNKSYISLNNINHKVHDRLPERPKPSVLTAHDNKPTGAYNNIETNIKHSTGI